MKYAAIEGPGKVVVKDGPVPEVGDSDILVKVSACGVCSATDLHYMKGELETNFPLTGSNSYFGHELSGVVSRVGRRVTEFKEGDRVAFLKGGYQQYALADPGLTVKIPDGLNIRQSLAEPLAVSLHTLNCVAAKKNETIIILGAGFMGLLLIQGLKHTGVENIVAVDLLNERLTQAKRCGAHRTVNPNQEDLSAVIDELTGQKGADIVVEAAGAKATLELAPKIVRAEGKIVVHGFYPKPMLIDMVPWHVKGLTIVNAHPATRDKYKILMAEGLEQLAARTFNMDPLITHEIPLARMDEVYRLLQKPADFIKVVVLPNEDRSE